jgi:hypothetical protein
MSKEKFLQEVARQKGNTNLKAQKIALSDVDDIKEFLSMSTLEDVIEEKISEAESIMIQARDIFRFDMTQHIGGAEDTLRKLKEKLDELGVDYPAVVNELETQLEERESAAEDIRQKFRDAGYDPIS